MHTQENGSVIVSMDAIFGLGRKKSAGRSVRGPLSGTTVFESQDAVNAFVASQSRSQDSSSEVSCIATV